MVPLDPLALHVRLEIPKLDLITARRNPAGLGASLSSILRKTQGRISREQSNLILRLEQIRRDGRKPRQIDCPLDIELRVLEPRSIPRRKLRRDRYVGLRYHRPKIAFELRTVGADPVLKPTDVAAQTDLLDPSSSLT